MAWWTIGIDDDEIGDQPANLVEIALDDFANAKHPEGGELPTPERFLTALVGSLQRHRYDVVGIEAHTSDGQSLIYGSRGDRVLDTLADELVSKLTTCYREYLDRNPRATEVCSVIAFVLRYRPDRFLAHAESWELRDLRPVPNDKSQP